MFLCFYLKKKNLPPPDQVGGGCSKGLLDALILLWSLFLFTTSCCVVQMKRLTNAVLKQIPGLINSSIVLKQMANMPHRS